MNRKMKQLILVLFAAAMLLSAAGCGGASSSSEEAALPADTASDTQDTDGTSAAEEEKTTPAPKKTVAEKKAEMSEVDAIDTYAPLLEHFYKLVSDPYGEDDDSDGSFGVQENARAMEDSAMDGIGYTIRDLNGDGVPELAVGTLPEYGGQINALYTLVDGELQLVFEGWYRNSYSYLGEGRFFYYSSGGVAETGRGVVSLTKDDTALEVETFYFTQLCDGEIRVYHNESGSRDLARSEEAEMTLEDFFAWEPAYEDLPMVSFTSYAADHGYEQGQNDTEYGDGSAVSVAWGYEAPIDMTGCETFTADDGEYSTDVVFYTVRPVSDFELMSLSISEVYDDGTVSYGAEPLCLMECLTPDCPLMVRMSFPGDIPAYGISYVDKDGDGMTHRLTVEISGEDGSLILRDTY